MSTLGTVRRSQLITTYGVGSVLAVGDESVMIAGIEKWPVASPDIHEPRLERLLRVSGFVRPPASSDDGGGDIPVVRFPSVYSCPGDCGRLDKIQFLSAPRSTDCLACGVPLVPSRFVVACKHGHIDDFPYFEWVHDGRRVTNRSEHKLTIGTAGVSASLSDVVIKCSCGDTKSMEGAFSRVALLGISKCHGRRPWIGDNEECSEIPRVLQRGASNVYFPITDSAISIPPWSEGIHRLIGRDWRTLQHITDGAALCGVVEGLRLTHGTQYSVQDLVDIIRQRQRGDNLGDVSGPKIRAGEFEALCQGKPEDGRDQDFVCVPSRGRDEVADIFSQVMSVTKLREVRALTGFARLTPPVPGDDATVAPLSRQRRDWLPAIEVVGEGVFFKLHEGRLATWEGQGHIQHRAEAINENYRRKFVGARRAPDKIVTPRLLLVHTLAHALINQWSLDCGYPAGSLRERLFVSEPEDASKMAGLLIYTATTDAAGSLGGIIARAEPGKLRSAVLDALRRVSWCSADPLCIESQAAGTDSLNLAACHACVLLPEVSCELQNSLLDRATLIGTPETPEIGFFSEFIVTE